MNMKKEHRYHSDLRHFSSSFSNFHMNKDINAACVDSSYQFVDVLDNNILSVDYSRNFLAPAMRLSCYEEVAALQPLTIHIRNKLAFLTYGHFQNFICSSFDPGFYLKVEKQFESPWFPFLIQSLKRTAMKRKRMIHFMMNIMKTL